MKTSCTTLLALVASASAHTLMSEIYIDGKAQGDGTCIRQPASAVGGSDPVEDLTSSSMACGHNGEVGVSTVCGVNGGQTLSFEFREWPDEVSKGPMDIGHKGPCAVYAKKVEDATTDGAVGAGWFKIWDEGFDQTANLWCTEKVILNGGHLSIIVPDVLQSGYYLLRSELLALHNANLSPPDPQYYPGCAQIFLSSSGSTVPAAADTVSIPGYTTIEDAGNHYNIYAENKPLPYPIPGPSVYSASAASQVASTVTNQTIGLPPANYIVRNANWYGTEIASYSTESDGWTSSKSCWTQVNDCYAKAPPTGSVGCKLLENKCNNVDDTLNGGTFTGPPNAGKTLDAAPVTRTDLPAPVNTGSATAGTNSNTATSSAAKASSTVAASSSAAAASTTADSYEDASTSASAQKTSTSSVKSKVAIASSADDEYATTTKEAASSVTAASSTPVSTAAYETQAVDSATPTTLITSSAPSASASHTKSRHHNQHKYKTKHHEDSDDSTNNVSEDDSDDTEDSDDSTATMVTVSDTDYVTVDVTVVATATPAVKRNARHFGHHRANRL